MEPTLKSLEDDLESMLRVKLGDDATQVRCRPASYSLYIFIQHSPCQPSSAVDIYSSLASFLRDRLSTSHRATSLGDWPNVQQILVGLYRKGSPAPYEKRKIQLTSVVNSALVTVGHKSGDSFSGPSSLGAANGSLGVKATKHQHQVQNQVSRTAALNGGISEDIDFKKTPKKTASPDTIPNRHAIPNRQTGIQNSADEPSLDALPSSEPEPSLRDKLVIPKTALLFIQKQVQNRLFLAKAAIVGLTLAVFGTGTYAMTRPCVMGSCEVLDTAQTLNQQSQELLSTATSATEIVNAYEKLLEANYQLEKIPFWSDHYDQARILISEYQEEADFVYQIVGAQRQAHEVTLSTQSPPYPLSFWEDVRGQWREAIAQLKAIPPDTDVAHLANTKLTEYQHYLSTIDHYISREQEAQSKIEAAREAAQIAEARENVANSADSWHLVYITWQVVMNRLEGIPKDTMAYAEAQHLNVIYSAQLTAAQAQNSREQLSYRSYTEATALASQAMQDEQSGRITQATVAWRNALSNIQQIPEGTSYYDQAQPLLSSYTEELARTEQALEIVALLEELRDPLNQACSSVTPICSYSLGAHAIEIFIEAPYADGVRQFVTAGLHVSNHEHSQADITLERSKIVVLLQTLTAISNDSTLAVELYDDDRRLIATYDPGSGGYLQADVAISVEN